MRCFNHFTEIISLVLKSDPRLNLTIVGKEKAVYRPLSSNSQSLKKVAEAKFTSCGVRERVEFHSRLDSVRYQKMFYNSDIHIYYSRPFVASWSLLESMSSGCTLVSNFTPMTEEFLITHDKHAALMTDCLNHRESAISILNLINTPSKMRALSNNAREMSLLHDYNLHLDTLRQFIGY